MRRLAAILISTGVALGAAAALRDAGTRWVAQTELPRVLAETSVEMRDRHGALLRVFPVEDGRWRLAVTPSQVDATFLAMLVRYEDRRFWQHRGVDPRAALRAVGQALWHRRVVSGGSTLTMQVARLLENGSTGAWPGKLRQIRVALALEARLTKEEILSLYLMHAPYGGGLEGVRAASLAWFGKEPARLTPAEATLLVALPQAPEARRPDRHPEAARMARDRVIARMQHHDALAAETAAAAQRAPVPQRRLAFAAQAPHLTEERRRADPSRPVHHLTIDAGMQRQLETMLARSFAQAPRHLSGAVLVADHQTGAVRALIGSPGYTDAARQGFIDMTRALRSPGSTLKPLIYGLAFDQGLAHPETVIHDGPVMFGRYAPQNFDGVFRGDLSVREALKSSLNIPVVRLTDALGPARVMAALSRAGVRAQVPGGKPGLAISLGGLGMSLRDLVQLYATLARGGAVIPLRYEPGPAEPGARLISPAAAWHLGDILSELAPPEGGRAGDIAYKTGTSYGHRDAWAVGWDGQNVVGVWVGRPDGTPVPGAYGADAAAPLLFQVFGAIKPVPEPLSPPPPETLMLGTAQLPLPLQRFRARGALAQVADPPQVIFPPDGARLSVGPSELTVKLRGGRAPYAVLTNGRPVAHRVYDTQVQLPHPGLGYSQITVIDAAGQADRVTVRLVD